MLVTVWMHQALLAHDHVSAIVMLIMSVALAVSEGLLVVLVKADAAHASCVAQ